MIDDDLFRRANGLTCDAPLPGSEPARPSEPAAPTSGMDMIHREIATLIPFAFALLVIGAAAVFLTINPGFLAGLKRVQEPQVEDNAAIQKALEKKRLAIQSLDERLRRLELGEPAGEPDGATNQAADDQ